MDTLAERTHRAIAAAQKGIVVNAGLAAVKVISGILGNSYALIADGIESGADVVSSLIVWRGLSISRQEATSNYHFGYGKAESVSAAIVSILLLGAAVGVLIAAVREIQTPHHLPEPFTLAVLAAVVVIKELLYRYVFGVSRDVESSSLKGEAWHHRSDALTSLAAFVGIGIALQGGAGWEQADDYAAIVCAIIIGSTGLSFLQRSVAELMDRAPETEVVEKMRAAAEAVEGVSLVEKLFARKSGLGFFVDMHVHANPAMSLYDAHIVSGKVKSAIRTAVPSVIGVMIHMEPEVGPRPQSS